MKVDTASLSLRCLIVVRTSGQEHPQCAHYDDLRDRVVRRHVSSVKLFNWVLSLLQIPRLFTLLRQLLRKLFGVLQIANLLAEVRLDISLDRLTAKTKTQVNLEKD